MPEENLNEPVVVTNRDIWKLANETRDKVNTLADTVPATQQDHEVRIRILERGFWKLVGASAVVGALTGTFGAYLLNQILSVHH